MQTDENRVEHMFQLIVCLFMMPIWFYFACGNPIPAWFLWTEFAFCGLGVLLNTYRLGASS